MTETIKCDVLVVGGGAAGIPAAVAAARSGAKVVVLEDDPTPGGAPVDNYVTYPCGNPKTGIYREMIRRIDACYRMPSASRESTGRREEDWYLPWAYSFVIGDMIRAESDNLQLLCGVRADAPILSNEGGRTHRRRQQNARRGTSTSARCRRLWALPTRTCVSIRKIFLPNHRRHPAGAACPPDRAILLGVVAIAPLLQYVRRGYPPVPRRATTTGDDHELRILNASIAIVVALVPRCLPLRCR